MSTVPYHLLCRSTTPCLLCPRRDGLPLLNPDAQHFKCPPGVRIGSWLKSTPVVQPSNDTNYSPMISPRVGKRR